MSQMPPEMAALARQNMGQPTAGPMGQPVPQQASQGLGQPLDVAQPMPTQQGMQQQAPMGMGLGKFA
jgi:hypothetical protein